MMGLVKRLLVAALLVLLPAPHVFALFKEPMMMATPAGPSASGGTLPLDIAPGAAFAYGLRRLRSAYTGAAVNIRRTTGSPPTTDIGFDASGNFDSSGFSSFCSGTTCFFTRAYDQTGNGRDCIMATAANQPQVTLSSLGGRASIQTTGNTGKMYCAAAANSALDFTGSGHTVLYELQYTATADGGGTSGGRGDALEVLSHFNPTGSYPGWAADAGVVDSGGANRPGATFVYTSNGSATQQDGTSGHLAAINDGNPHFAGWSFASGTVKIYQDSGIYTSTLTFPTPATTGQQMTVLAANDTSIDSFFSGNLAEIYGWSTTLTPSQIASIQSGAATYYAGSGAGVACVKGPNYTATIPAPAVRAGFNTCFENLDFNTSFGATLSNWLDCAGASTPLWLNTGYNTRVAPQSPCTNYYTIVSDTVGSATQNVLDMAYTNAMASAGINGTWMQTGTLGSPGPVNAGTFPVGAYVELQFKILPANPGTTVITSSTLPICAQSATSGAMSTCTPYLENMDWFGVPATQSGFLESDAAEMDANGGNVYWGGRVGTSLGTISAAYHTIGTLLTTDGLGTNTSYKHCKYLDGAAVGSSCINVQQEQLGLPPLLGTTKYSNWGTGPSPGNSSCYAGCGAHDGGCTTPCPALSQTLHMRITHILVFTCSGYASAQCGPLISTP